MYANSEISLKMEFAVGKLFKVLEKIVLTENETVVSDVFENII